MAECRTRCRLLKKGELLEENSRRDSRALRAEISQKLEPLNRFELMTYRLQGGCSTTELKRLLKDARIPDKQRGLSTERPRFQKGFCYFARRLRALTSFGLPDLS